MVAPVAAGGAACSAARPEAVPRVAPTMLRACPRKAKLTMRAIGHAALLAAVVLVVLPVSAAFGSDTFLAFGPKDYTRVAGQPMSVKDTFSVLNPNTSCVLRVYNGGKGSPIQREVFSAAITLNGVKVVRHSEFNPRVSDNENPKDDSRKYGSGEGAGRRETREPVSYIEKPVVLASENELSVEMHGRPDSVMTIEIIGVDDDPPTIVVVLSPPPNAAGWNNSDVTVSFSCADATSGIASCSAPVPITSECVNQVVTGTAIDGAGHSTSVSAVVNLDKTAPAIAAQLSGPPDAAGWHAAEVTAGFECADALSGIQSCPGSVSVGDGVGQVISGTAVDRAGNTASASVTLNVDTAPPIIKAKVDPPPNAAGWNWTDVTVSFDCSDATSGIASCSPPVGVGNEGANQWTTGTATDKAGHSTTVSVVVNLDKTAPTIATQLSGSPHAAGWHSRAVNVRFECADALSGIESCPEPVSVGDGAGQVVSGTAVDRAGNAAEASETLNVDTAPPTITAQVDPPPNAAGWNRSDVTVSFECSDATSGVTSCPEPVQVTSEGGGHVVAGTVTDRGGHGSRTSVTVNLDKTPPDMTVAPQTQPKEPALEVLYVRNFQGIWTDSGSGAQRDGAFYRPVAPAGYSVLGYYGQGNYGAPDGVVAVVRELVLGALAPPVRYDVIWTDSGSGSDRDGAFWRPVPPPGYTCLGVVVTGYAFGTGYAPPSLDAIRCVNSDLVAPAKAWMSIWDDNYSGAHSDLGTWVIAPSNEDGVHLGLMAAQGYGENGGYAPPTSGLWVLDRKRVRGAEFPLNDRALEVQYIDDFELAWEDSGSGADRDGAFYRPAPPAGFFAVGYYGQGNHSQPNGLVAVVRELISGALAQPVAYEEIWRDAGSGANRDAAFWRPIPPAGYACLGVVVTGYDFGTGYAPPSLDAVRCVRAELTTPASIDRSIWDDRGSGADRDLSTWHLVPNSVGGVYLGTFTGGGSYDAAPEWPVYVLREAVVTADAWVLGSVASFNGVASDALSGLDTVSCNGTAASLSASAFLCEVPLSGHTPVTIIATDVAGNEALFSQIAISATDALEVSYSTSFEPVWDDSGSGASYNGAFYRPVMTSGGFAALGHYGQSDYGDPVGVLLLASERTPRALAAPVGYELIWTDAGSGATNDGAFWWPLPPPGYRCLGVVATGYPQGGGYGTPSLGEVRCVRKELVAPGYVGSQIWNDDRSLADRDFGSWQIAPSTGEGLHSGTFTGRSYPSDRGYAKPTLPVYVLDACAIAGSTPLSEEEVGDLITRYAPVVRLHPADPYLPDDPEQILNVATLQWALVRNEGAYCWPPYMSGSNGQYFEHLDEMPTSAADLMTDVAHIESDYKPNPPYSNDPDFRIWLSIPDASVNGDLERAKPLVHARARGPFTEIQFWFFYPFNGSGRVEICVAVLGCEVDWFGAAGRHYGDWEMVSLLVDNRSGGLVAAGLSQHGAVEWVRYDRLEKYTDGVRPLIYAAYHSHANYRSGGRHDYEVAHQTSTYTATLFDITDTSGQGPLFVVGDYIRARVAASLLPDWLGFPYRWGQYIWNHEDVEYMSTNYYDENEVNPGPTGPPKKSEW